MRTSLVLMGLQDQTLVWRVATSPSMSLLYIMVVLKSLQYFFSARPVSNVSSSAWKPWRECHRFDELANASNQSGFE